MVERDFKHILAEYIKANELTQSKFAAKIGVKPSQVNEWLKGKANPSYDMIKRMSVACEVSAEYFLGIIDYF